MPCPDCNHDNIQGAEICANCGRDLQGLDIPGVLKDYGGGFVYSRDGSVKGSEPFIEFTHGVETDGRRLTVYRVDVPDDVFSYHNWAKPAAVGSSIGMDPDELRSLGRSGDTMDRANVIVDLAGHYGWHELDQYPLTLSPKALAERWGIEE